MIRAYLKERRDKCNEDNKENSGERFEKRKWTKKKCYDVTQKQWRIFYEVF